MDIPPRKYFSLTKNIYPKIKLKEVESIYMRTVRKIKRPERFIKGNIKIFIASISFDNGVFIVVASDGFFYYSKKISSKRDSDVHNFLYDVICFCGHKINSVEVILDDYYFNAESYKIYTELRNEKINDLIININKYRNNPIWK